MAVIAIQRHKAKQHHHKDMRIMTLRLADSERNHGGLLAVRLLSRRLIADSARTALRSSEPLYLLRA